MQGLPVILFLVLALIVTCQAGKKRYGGYRSSYGKGAYSVVSPYAYGKSAGYRTGYGKYGYRRQLGEVEDSEDSHPAVMSASPSDEGHRVLYGKAGAATVAVPTVAYSKSYRPVQSTRAVTSVRPVVSYKPVTEYQTVRQYQPTLSKHHSTATAYVTSSKGRRVLYGKAGAATVAVPTVSYSKSYRPVQSTHAVTSLKPVVSYKPVTEYQTTTGYQPALEKYHPVSSYGKQGYRRYLGEGEEGAADLESVSAEQEDEPHAAEDDADAESTTDQVGQEQYDLEGSDVDSTAGDDHEGQQNDASD